eukprot:1691053-Pyramimonas_sp.AAC.1
MQDDWFDILKEKAASKLGAPGARLDPAAALAALKDLSLSKQERGCLLTFLTQGCWTKARAKDAGYP